MYAIAELLGHIPRILRERLCRIAQLPAALVLKRLWQVPVVQCGERSYPGGDELIDKPVVEVQAFSVRCTGPLRKDARPGDRESICVHTKVLHQLHVFFVTMVVIVGDVAGRAVLDVAWRMRICIPDRLSLAVFIGRAFDLVRRRADAPIKILWKLSPFMHWSASIVQRFPTSLCGFTQVRIWRTGLNSEFNDVGRE